MSSFAALNLLLVEDSVSQLQYLAGLCRSLGVVQLQTAGNGHQALALARQQAGHLDIAICDLEMPDMDGVELIRRLAEERLVTHLIILSGLDYSLLNTVAAMAQMRGMVVLGRDQQTYRRQPADFAAVAIPATEQLAGQGRCLAANQPRRTAQSHHRLRPAGVFSATGIGG
jgi:CheY-like chemotaxis protein